MKNRISISDKKVIVIGYGSIGKKHVGNLSFLGIKPYVLTSHPDGSKKCRFIDSLKGRDSFDHAIIATPTGEHLKTLKMLSSASDCKNILIEKPLASSLNDTKKIEALAEKKGLNISVGYDMRFLKVFDLIKKCIKTQKKNIRIVKIQVGQYLPEWRPNRDYRNCYSVKRNRGGGVDLDLSHELDYMLWIFGTPQKTIFTLKKRLSSLTVDSPDYFKGLYAYNNYVVDVEMDYIRKLERTLTILGENTVILKADFISRSIEITDRNTHDQRLFDYNKAFIDEVKEFLGLIPKKNLCGLKEAADTMRLLGLER